MKKTFLVSALLLTLYSSPVFADNSYKITISPTPVVGTTQVTITAVSLLPISSSGSIAVKKTTEAAAATCTSTTFPSSAPSTPPCVVGVLSPLTPGNYSVTIIARGTDGKTYNGASEFSIPGPVTTNPPTTTTPPPPPPQTTTSPGTTSTPPTTPSTASNAGGGITVDVHLQNPLKVSTITEAVTFFVDTLLKLAIPFIVIFFLWAGLKFILALGKPDKITEAKKMFWYTVIGTLLILGAWTITNAIIGTVNSITG